MKSGTWKATTDSGEVFSGRIAVMAQEPLSNASFPAISGLEDYQGHKIHSDRWDHDCDFKGKESGGDWHWRQRILDHPGTGQGGRAPHSIPAYPGFATQYAHQMKELVLKDYRLIKAD